MSGLDIEQVKYLVVKPALQAIGLYEPAGLNLVVGTGLVESAYIYLHQEGSGPALGLWQMEPATHDDLWKNYLPKFPQTMMQVQGLLPRKGMAQAADSDLLVGNLAYAAAMCRIKYMSAPEALPQSTNALALAEYWKQIYNSSLGAGVVDASHVAAFQTAIAT